ncbi:MULTISPECIES: alpha/beta hydrolase family protein [unclassified Janthinobacterium]|uniref:alpha/beta hydrolase family protein n=1 Tax=unclassified Janthinobacterium TaxID=2610881 RepID=UPI00034D98CD|nr:MULTISPECIES: CocE/NonD family hydrolase [unclassified Janthinobacterium]MEC5160474.1 dienelactone hydrolase [Janthinobacterium sp. CG_S6]
MVLCSLLTPSSAIDPVVILDGRLNETIIMVPAGPDGEQRLETTVFRPSGTGPFPLLVINHGKQPGNPQMQKRDRFLYMATAFVRRGYAVMVPMRTGFARSSGSYADYGCNMTANGYAQAEDVLDAIRYARGQSWVDADRIVVAGQSYGGLASMALAAQQVPGVRGVINIAGGLRVDGGQCDWQSALVKAFANFGARNQIASLWMYGANDSYFGPHLVGRMYRSFVHSGGTATLRVFPAFKRDAHVMLASRDGEKVWLPDVERFLRQIDMPTAEVYAVAEPPTPARTDFASLDDVEAVPYLPDSGREAYREFLGRLTPRAFALSASGAWGWAEEGESPDERAVAACQIKSSKPCRLYTVDDYVVWPATAATAAAGTTTTAAAGSTE